MKFQYFNAKEWGIETKIFSLILKRSKKLLLETEGDLNVVFTDDAEIQKLNREYRKKDAPTDVLSFSYLGTPSYEASRVIGEIFISVPMMKRQAKEYGQTEDAELCKLFAHGLLHIFGYDHEKDEDYDEMAKKETELLG